ncbi:hypothetical protein IGJ02_000392 [Enterococcus sp. DIV0724b]|uniref:hypothetical protein n=1 Tax=Enterococcus sp. DIV0724b TaxID=2774694 RepID=UPI003D2FDE4F
MIRLLQQTSLKTITLDLNGENKIENIDSILVSRIRIFLNNMYNSQLKHSFSIDRRNYDNNFLDVISFFRGFSPNFNCNHNEIVNEKSKVDYFQDFFIVGEKGKAYRENVLLDGSDPYFDNNPEMNDVEELLKLVNLRLKRNNFGNIEMSRLLRSVNNNTISAYMFLLNLAHNIGERWGNKCRSPFVSAAYGNMGFKNALYFAQNRNNDSYSHIIWGFIRKSDKENYILTRELSENLGMLDAEWYDDIHSEIIIKDGIFPHNILGAFEIDNETGWKDFIINPYLYQLFDVNKRKQRYNLLGLTEYVCQNGIPIDQNIFDECARSLGYHSYGYRLHNGYTSAGEIGREANLHLPRNHRFTNIE